MTRPFHALIDLDGTLTDPAPGITGSVRHALNQLGLPAPPPAELTWVVGPPMRQTLLKLGVPAERVELAIRHYRDFYHAGAMFDAQVYPGIPAALSALVDAGLHLVVATSKSHVFARPILDRFDLSRHFSAVHGAELDGRNDDKGDLLAHIIAAEGVDTARAVMIGDRLFDAHAARRHGIPCIGVLWGYGSRAELAEAGVTELCETPTDLPAKVLALAAARQAEEARA